jgi:dolichyl-phosphate beta-glucosyltransferase
MRRHAAVVASAVTVVCAMVLALGGHLTIHGPPTRIPLPWIIPEHLPVLDNILPVRLMVAGYLALAVIVTVFLDRVLEAPIRLRIAGLAATVVALVPLVPSLPISSAQFAIPGFFTDGSAQRLPPTGSVLITPYGGYPPEVWQAAAGISFKTQLGLVFTPGPGGHEWNAELDPLGAELTALGEGATAPAQLSAADRATYLGDMSAHDVTTVIVGPATGSTQVAQLMTELLGRPGTSTGGVTVWYDVGAVTG